MKTIYTALITIAFFAMNPLMNAQNFYLAPNGVTCMCPEAAFGETGVVNGVTYTKRTKQQITWTNAATTCTSGITDMSYLFSFNSDLTASIHSWDVSNVTNMERMFSSAVAFNQPLNNWDVSSVTNMKGMFASAITFNKPLNNWDVSNVTDMSFMFYCPPFSGSFNQSLDNWNVSNVTDMSLMFGHQNFNKDIGNWDVSNVTNMYGMFSTNFSFNQDISGWCVEQIPEEPAFFAFKCPINEWFKPLWGEECVLSIASVSISQIDIKLYPNPTRDVFILDNQSEHSIETITIINMQGQVVKQVNGNYANTQQINIFDLASGNYFVQIDTNKTILFKRVIKN